MTRASALLISLLVSFTLAGCGEHATAPDRERGVPRNAENPGQARFQDGSSGGRQAIVQADNRFGLTLFKEITAQDSESNVVISPLSVAIALGMTVNGARGTTLEDMKAVLGLSGYSMDEVNRHYRGLVRLLLGLDPAVEFRVANSIWCREGIPFKQDFLAACDAFFDAQVTSLDFGSPDASDIINSWVLDRTRGRITEIVDDPIDPLTMIFLINAIYFKGDWQHAFDPAETYDTSFMLSDGTLSPCRMMCQPETTDFYTYLSAPGFDALDMPYGDSVFSMTILLPRYGQPVESVIEELTWSDWEAWMQDFQPWSGRVLVPRFEIEYDLTMNDVLASIGMGIIFDHQRADFTRMCDFFGDFYVKKVKHKTYIRVDELGTEAAAVTSVEMGPTSVPDTFLVNRPFVFVIRENHHNTILFIGRVTDPGYFTG
jgi:serpin B